jgi:gentisate 1,2-dioxygenase
LPVSAGRKILYIVANETIPARTEALMAVATPSKPTDPKHNLQAARQAYYDKISKYDMAPLWEVLKDLVTKEPKTQCVPALWKFEDAKKFVLEAGEVITAEEAERRVLVLENPALRGKSRVTNALFAGIQLILPGEIAPAHRHVASAIRFVLDGEGAYTAVEGEKAIMSPGDFLITANWAPHDHGISTSRCRIRRAATATRSPSMARACCRTARRPT